MSPLWKYRLNSICVPDLPRFYLQFAVVRLRLKISLTVSPNPTIQIVAHAATPMRGTTPRNRPLTPVVARIYLKVDRIVGDVGRAGSFFIDCISTRSTCRVSNHKPSLAHLRNTYFEWLVPAAQCATDRRCQDFLPKLKLLVLRLAIDLADAFFGKTRNTNPRRPTRDLS